MLPRTSFPQFQLPRLAKARDRLAAAIWQVQASPLVVLQTPPIREHRRHDEVGDDEFRPVTQSPHHWGELFDQCWWKVDLPPVDDGNDHENQPPPPRYLSWRDQAEATVYVDGVPHYGIDPGHAFAPLPPGAESVVVESLCARTGVWVTGEPQGLDPQRGSRFDGAYLATRNDQAWSAYHDLDVLLQLLALLDKPDYPPDQDLLGRGGYRPEITRADPLLRRLIDRLDGAVDELDRRGIAACGAALRQVYEEFPAEPSAMEAVLTGHAHVDLVWLWPERAGEFKAVHSFANALRMIERYPEARFGYSQPASYEAVARRSPEIMDGVRDAIGRQRWEATGALYVESDVQLPCGEALVRAFALGQAGFRDLRGQDSRCVWLPDVFGYSACLPTIMAGFDVPYFYTTKLHWSGATRFPHSSFRWVGMDGSAVTAHVSWRHYNQEVTPEELHNAQLQHRQAAVHPEALVPCGYGDGGGGLNEAMCERARRLADLARMPRARWGGIEDFFDRLAQRGDRLPTWRGEMYLEYHRGVQTTHGDLKAAFRAAEVALQTWEAVRCATGGGPIDEQPWKRLCFAQFHDYIPGSSIAEVYREAVPELRAIAEAALQSTHAELAATAEASGPGAAEDEGQAEAAEPADRDGASDGADPSGAEACVFNPLAMRREAWIDGRLVSLPPLAGVAVAGLEARQQPPPAAENRRLTNGRVDVSFNDSGEIGHLMVDGHPVALERPGAQVFTFPDLPAAYDAWDIDRPTLSLGTHHENPAIVEHDTAEGSASITFSRGLVVPANPDAAGDPDAATDAGELRLGTIEVCYTLEAGSPVLRIDIELDLHQPQTLVKLAFPTAYRGREARYGGPFGSVRRPQWTGPLANEAMFENPGSRWATVSDDDDRDGLMLITQAKYGFGARDGLLHVSLARSAQVTPVNVAGTTTTLGGVEQGEEYADLGRQKIRLAVGRFTADAPRQLQPAALADLLFTPPLRYVGQPMNAGLREIDAPPSLVPAWAVPGGEGGWTLRLHETLGGRGTLCPHLDSGRSATATDLRGRPLPTAGPSIRVKPYTLHSLQIR